MKINKKVLFLTIITTLLSIYYLSFTVVDYNVLRKAEQHAMDGGQKVDFDRKQAYLTDVWKKPVYRLFGFDYTYEEVKDRSLKFGLDLQGGMHVTLEISPIELVKGLVTNATHPPFLAALEWAQQEKEKGVQTSFSKLFMAAYKKLAPQEDIKELFTTTENQARSYHFSSEQDVTKAIDQEIDKALHRSLTIVRSRLDRFGTFQPNIQQLPGSSRIQIELPGVTHPERVRKLLEGVAQLRLYEVAEVDTYGTHLQAINDFLLKEERDTLEATFAKDITEAEKEQLLPKQSILSRLAGHHFPYLLSYPTEAVDQIKAIWARKDIQAMLPPSIIWMWDKKPHGIQDSKASLMLYPIKLARDKKPLLDGNIITHAAQVLNQEDGKPMVSMQMNSEGARSWKRITANHIGKRIAIALDDQVYSAPTVHQEIPNGHSQISGNFTLEEAKDLASVLQAGSLPAPLKIVEEAIIGPSLGKEAQRSGLIATAVGLALVLLFMMAYYGKGGAVANLALGFNLLFIVGIFAQLDATLTLPGIAGLVLTIGMSIDANVLIFERIREELVHKTPIKEAIKRGYTKSYSSIIDSNITTFLAGAILYYLGQGQVKGFALILMIGIVSSIFASIFVTQLLFAYFIDNVRTTSWTFSSGIIPQSFKHISFDFIKNRFYFYAFSLLIILVGGVCCYQQKGLVLGVDFSGGRSYIVECAHPIDSSLLKEKLSPSFEGRVEVRTYGANNVMHVTTSYLSQDYTAVADQKVAHKLMKVLQAFTQSESHTEDQFTIINSSRVGAAVATDVQKSAQKAIVFALVGIFFYVVLRFRKWSFALAAVSALIHDTCIVVAGFCIAHAFGFSYEVNEVFLAAILTIIGYSINDTIVIFDRIREGLKDKKSGLTIEPMLVNRSIGSTLSRTLITSFTTLLTVVMLFCFGGAALRGFSFALLLGILFGTYSSICIAAPFLADLSTKRDKNKWKVATNPNK